MSTFPLAYGNPNYLTTSDLSIPPSASAWTKGAWVEWTAGYPMSIAEFTLTMFAEGDGGGTPERMLFDIGTGASGSETVLVSNIAARGSAFVGTCSTAHIPISIPANTRISVRSQRSFASANTLYVSINPIFAGPYTPVRGSQSATYGVNTTNFTSSIVVPSNFFSWGTPQLVVAAVPFTVRAIGTYIMRTADNYYSYALQMSSDSGTVDIVGVPHLFNALATNAEQNYMQVWPAHVRSGQPLYIAGQGGDDTADVAVYLFG